MWLFVPACSGAAGIALVEQSVVAEGFVAFDKNCM